MKLISWEKLPPEMQNEEVRPYYESLAEKRGQLLLKRLLDILGASTLLVLLSPLFAILSVAIKLDSSGPVFYRQVRVTQYGRQFRIFKFRTMYDGADRSGAAVTVDNDLRVTRVGGAIRRMRLDEIGQLVNVLAGEMTFVGTRPEVPRYVDKYTPAMRATLLLPAGVTSAASIKFRDESRLLKDVVDVDRIYLQEIVPKKMIHNLIDIQEFSLRRDLGILFETIVAVFGQRDRS